MSPSGVTSNRITALLTRLRDAMQCGVPAWLRTAVAGCVAELERISAATTPHSDADAICAQAETLLVLIAGSDEAGGGVPTEVVGEATQRHLERARHLLRQARHRFGGTEDDDGHAGDQGGA